MRCLKSVNTERRDEFNRRFLKSLLIWLAALCIIFLARNFFTHDDFSTKYNLLAFIGLLLIYPLHKMLHILAAWKYRAGVAVHFKRHFYIMPCMQVRIHRIIPKWRYIASLIFPFVLISVCLIGLMVVYPLYNTPIFLILLSVHIGMSYPDFIHIRKLWHMPRNCFVEDAERGFSILISD
ncbi:DUF3267 domain-containing protein [Listeria costaricensis]|uniref:DUF3267 domain-containing protein n=1 Tax=Listeria costaricensis TaxID=2026604 RepID=UPI000C06DBD7|nr:DUF3267 domain-containing protein [Listeria costaricensis]